jgi:hypothetical protein
MEQAPFTGVTPRKIDLIAKEALLPVEAIKLLRTDTTLDLSQKAEKGMTIDHDAAVYIPIQVIKDLWS